MIQYLYSIALKKICIFHFNQNRRLKISVKILKKYVQERVIKKEIKNKIIRNNDVIVRNKRKIYFKTLIKHSQLKKFYKINLSIKKSRYYLLFFSKICNYIRLNYELDKIYVSFRSKYKDRIKKQAFKGLLIYSQYATAFRSNFLRKKLVQKIFFKNLKDKMV